MTLQPRRAILGAAALGMTTMTLPSAISAASDSEEPTPTVAFAPEVQFEGVGVPPDSSTRIHMAWAEGYTYNQFGPAWPNGTTGAKAAFSYNIVGTDTSGDPVSSSGTSDGSFVSVVQSSLMNSTVTATVTSTEFSGDARTFTYTRT